MSYAGIKKRMEKIFCPIVEKYDLKFAYQSYSMDKTETFYGPMDAYSIYNKNGCFTIYIAVQRAEVYYYYASRFSSHQKDLLQKEIFVRRYEEELWEKEMHWYSSIMQEFRIVATIIQHQIENQKAFFGIKI